MRWRGRSVVGIVVVTAGLAGCSAAGPGGITAPDPVAVSTPASSAPSAPLTSSEERTLASLKLLDDHPLYEMTYVGGLPPILPAAGAPDPAETTGPSGLRRPFG